MLFRNPYQSAQEFLKELAQSLRTQGVLAPLIVRELGLDCFEVVAGARRFRAARLEELASVPIREDVHPYEEAMAYKAFETSEPRYDVAPIAAKTGRSITHVYQRLRLAELIGEGSRGISDKPYRGGACRPDRSIAARALLRESDSDLKSALSSGR